MESSPSLETVFQAVYTLYMNPDPAEQEKASTWLGELQKSVYAWKIADQILHRYSDLQSCYFAAQTLRTKIQLSFHELPIESHPSLRDSLMDHIGKVGDSTDSSIVTQLCLALADLVLQMSSWKKPVSDLIARYSSSAPLILLVVLAVLPEEAGSRVLRLGENRREEVMHDFATCSPEVSQFLKVCLETSGDNVEVQIKVLKCFMSWISIQAISIQDLANNVVVAAGFHSLRNHNTPLFLHEAASDCVCSLLKCLEDNNNQQDLEMQLFQSVLILEEAYHFSVAHEEIEKCLNYCRVFTELGECFLDKIIACSTPDKPHYAIKVFDLVLICVGHHDYEMASITFNLWYRLSEELYQKKNKGLTGLFKPYMERLISALCRHCQMEPDHEGVLDEGDDFSEFRLKVSELVRDVVFTVGSSTIFTQMFLSLQSPSPTWDSLEAALFIMQSIAKNILPKENDVVPKVIKAILSSPPNTHIAVRYTSILLLGELCEWMEKHPEYLEPVLNMVILCLQHQPLASAAANCLQSIFTACRDHMVVRFSALSHIVQSLESFSISNGAAVGLLKGITVILSKLPPNQMQEAVKEVCLIQVKPLCHLVENDIKVVEGSKTDPAVWMDRLAAIFRHLDHKVENGEIHPCQPVLTEIWPVLSSVFTKYHANSRIMERSCRCLRFAIRCVGLQATNLLEPLVKQMVTLYSQHQHSCFLYLGSILVDEYACEPGCVQGLLDMLQAFIGPTFAILQEENGLRNHPDTVDDLFRLCGRFLQRAPRAFLTSPTITPILQCALMAIALDHKDANASVMRFFCDLIHAGRSREPREDLELRRTLVMAIIQEKGQELINNLTQASVFCLRTYMLTDIADVIIELMQADREAVNRWMGESLKMMPTQNSAGTITATRKQLEDFHMSFSSAEDSKKMTSILKEFVRLYR